MAGNLYSKFRTSILNYTNPIWMFGLSDGSSHSHLKKTCKTSVVVLVNNGQIMNMVDHFVLGTTLFNCTIIPDLFSVMFRLYDADGNGLLDSSVSNKLMEWLGCIDYLPCNFIYPFWSGCVGPVNAIIWPHTTTPDWETY